MEPKTERGGKDLRHKTMSIAAAEHLRLRIINGDFPAGSALRQDALAEELGISRIPLREALMQLEAQGLVRIVPHKGAIVAELSSDEVEELFELRALLEPMLLKRSASRLLRSDYRALRQLVVGFRKARKNGDLSRWGRLNTEFHLVLYQHANRSRALSIVSNLLQDTDRHTRLQLSFVGAMARAEEEHAQIVELCEKDKVDEACMLLHDHILNGVTD
jgi:DNA-binding GntR family transcriptional regulator